MRWPSQSSFRGLIAPASLKQAFGDPGDSDQQRFPGFNRPGLIEAQL